MAPLDPMVRRFFRAAEQRYTAAEVLFAEHRNLEAMYLAGYVVECATKALILARTVRRGRAVVVAEVFRGRRGHDFEELKALLKCSLPPEVAHSYRHVSSWSTDLRYEVGLVPTEDAKAFLQAAQRIMQWVGRSL